MKLNEKLDKMIGKTFMYNTRYYRILSYDLDDQLTIATDKKWFKFSLDKAESALKEFLPVEQEIEIKSLVILPKANEMLDLKNVILENISNVQKDKSYIAQANSISKSIAQLINMARLEIGYAKLMNKSV